MKKLLVFALLASSLAACTYEPAPVPSNGANVTINDNGSIDNCTEADHKVCN